MNKHNYALARD